MFFSVPSHSAVDRERLSNEKVISAYGVYYDASNNTKVSVCVGVGGTCEVLNIDGSTDTFYKPDQIIFVELVAPINKYQHGSINPDYENLFAPTEIKF